ncbi:MAG: ankyrin repeat domain-containing protein, partial [Bacteroidota bacterium]
ANVDRHSNGETPLSLAVSTNQLEQVAYLLKQGADVSKKNENGDSPLYIATVKGYDMIAGMLLHKSEDAVGDVNWESELGEPLINIAAQSNSAALVETMLEFGADVTKTDYMDNTALSIAAQNGNRAMVEALLASGTDVNHINMMGATATMLAAKNGHQDIANLLVEYGGNPEIRNYEGVSASQYANFDGIMVRRYHEESASLSQDYEQTKEIDNGIYHYDEGIGN